MKAVRKTAEKRATRKLAPLTVVDWRKYCYDAKYKDIFKYDYSNDTERVRMAKLGYMQLTLCKMLIDQFGNDVTEKLQFKRLDATNSEVLYFQTWTEVKDFCRSEEFVRAMLLEQERRKPSHSRLTPEPKA